MKFKTITDEELKNGFINKEFIDFENKVMTDTLTKADKKMIREELEDIE